MNRLSTVTLLAVLAVSPLAYAGPGVLDAAKKQAADAKEAAEDKAKEKAAEALAAVGPGGKDLVKGKVLADTSAIVPGRPFRLGIWLDIQPEWHVYWKNPGEAGLATELEMVLPKGFKAGPVQYPRPESFSDPGGIKSYGYAGKVLLTRELHPPENLKPGSKVTIPVGVTYLACKSKCIPGAASLQLQLPVAKSARPDNAKLFEEWSAKTPQPAPDFSLKDQAGKTHSLGDYRGKVVVLEWFNPDCPFIKRHHAAHDTMKSLAKAHASADVVFLAVNSTHYMTPEKTAQWHEDWSLAYPVLIDRDGEVGQAYGAKTTPHMFVIDGEGLIVYQGALDDDPGGKNTAKARNHVAAALADLKAGRPVAEPKTKPYGCSVKYAPKPKPKAEKRREAPNFTLKDQAGDSHSLSDYKGKWVVLEWFNPDCPFVKRHHEKHSTFKDLAKAYQPKGVVFLAVNSTHYMTPEKTAEWHTKWKMPYPVLIDRDGETGRAYGAKTTPHVFVISPGGRIVYEGAIDDDPKGRNTAKAENHLQATLDAVLADKKPPTARTKQYGCSVKYAK